MYKCHSIEMDSDITLPYACSYSHQSKRGGKPLLALSTEQGTVLIVNTEKRNGWDAGKRCDFLSAYMPLIVISRASANGFETIR